MVLLQIKLTEGVLTLLVSVVAIFVTIILFFVSKILADKKSDTEVSVHVSHLLEDVKKLEDNFKDMTNSIMIIKSNQEADHREIKYLKDQLCRK